jgi:hypothetical protein
VPVQGKGRVSEDAPHARLQGSVRACPGVVGASDHPAGRAADGLLPTLEERGGVAGLDGHGQGCEIPHAPEAGTLIGAGVGGTGGLTGCSGADGATGTGLSATVAGGAGGGEAEDATSSPRSAAAVRISIGGTPDSRPPDSCPP